MTTRLELATTTAERPADGVERRVDDGDVELHDAVAGLAASVSEAASFDEFDFVAGRDRLGGACISGYR